MDQLSETAINAVADLARANGASVTSISTPGMPGVPTSVPALIDPKTGAVKSVKTIIEEYRTRPARKSGIAVVETLTSFIDLVDRHKTDHSVIFADPDWQKPSLTAVIDYHDKESGGAADNGKHRIQYPFPLSEEWKAWVENNGQKLDQKTFAEFIEDRIADLTTPDEDEARHWQSVLGGRVAAPNDIMTLSRGLKLTAETKVAQHQTIATGEAQISFEEEHRDEKGEKINVPNMFIIRVPPFFQAEAVRIPVRLRYRLVNRQVIWFYQLYRPEKYISDEVELSLERAAGATDLPHFLGAPEMSA